MMCAFKRSKMVPTYSAATAQANNRIVAAEQPGGVPTQLRGLTQRNHPDRNHADARDEIGMPARQEDSADHGKGEHHQKHRVLQRADMLPDEPDQHDAEDIQQRQCAVAPSAVSPAGGCEHGEGDVQGTQGEQAPGRHADIHRETTGKPGHARRHENGDDGHQPDIVEQVNARVLPNRARNQLRAVDVRPHY
jgi:hypothetical protein